MTAIAKSDKLQLQIALHGQGKYIYQYEHKILHKK